MRTTNWTIVPCPTPAWASLVYPRLEPRGRAGPAVGRDRAHLPGSTSPTRSPAGRAGSRELTRVSRRAQRPAARRASGSWGPGTDLTIGLLPSSTWLAGRVRRPPSGIEHQPEPPHRGGVHDARPRAGRRRPSPRPSRCSPPGPRSPGSRSASRAAARSTIDADAGRRGAPRTDRTPTTGAARLGEVALVDREGRIGPLETVFFDTLLDENAASHIALGPRLSVGVAWPSRRPTQRANVAAYPHRLHDRQRRGRRSPDFWPRRRRGPAAARRHMADLTDRARGHAGTGSETERHATLPAASERCRSG